MALPNLNKSLYVALKVDAGVAAIVGTKIYLLKNMAGTSVPYLVYYLASNVPQNINPSELHNYIYRVDCWESKPPLARTLASAVFDALHLQTLTVTSHTNYWTAVEREQSFVDTVDETEFYRHVLDVRIKTTDS